MSGQNWWDTLSILGATMQDAGMAAWNKPGYALQDYNRRKEEERARQQYQSLIEGISPQPVDSVPISKQAPEPGWTGKDLGDWWKSRAATANAPTSRGLISGDMVPLLRNLDPSIGMPLLMQFIKQAGEDYTLGEGQRRYNSRGQLVAENPNPSDKTGPFTDVGKLAEDYKSGSIDKAIYDAAMANLTSTRPDNGPRTAGGMYWDPNQKKWLNIPGYEETALRIAQAGAGNPGIVQSVHAIEGGKLLIVRRDGRTEVVTSDGKPVMDARTDPSAIFDRSAAASAGTQAGKDAQGRDTTETAYINIMKTLDAFDDPKVKSQASSSLGYMSMAPTLPGVNSDFRARMDQLKGEVFLQAYNTLRGSQGITDVEGEKATNAYARLGKAQTPDEFYRALKDVRENATSMQNGIRARARRGQSAVPQLRQTQQQSGWSVRQVGQ